MSIQDVEKFGGKVINDVINDGSLKEIFNTWGVGKMGTNQLLDHTIGKEIERISEIAKRTGIEPEELIGIFSENPLNKIQALKRFDELTDQIIKNAPIRNLNLKAGKQEAYYLPSINKPDVGVIVLKYEGKKSTMMLAGRDYYEGLGVKNL